MAQSESSYLKSKESGQAVVLVVLALGILLLGTTALAVDFTNLWFHQQAAQSAADAACTAGAQEMLQKQNDPSFVASFTAGTALNCTTSSTASPCWYARENGYSSNGATPGNTVSVSFPSGTCPGPVLDPAASGYPYSSPGDCPAPGVTPAAGANRFIRVDILERVGVAFVGLFNGTRAQNVRVFSVCGVISQDSTVPIAVLAPHMDGSFTMTGNAKLLLAGGAGRSIAINSDSSGAADLTTNVTLNIAYGAPDYCGGILTVHGGPSGPLPGFVNMANAGYPNAGWSGTLPSCSGTMRDPLWRKGSDVPDSLALVAAPSGFSGSAPGIVHVAYGVDGCPDVVNGCDEYRPGNYPGPMGINVSGKTTAIFMPGLYTITGGFTLGANSCARPALQMGTTGCPYCTGSSGATFSSDGGTTFYFADDLSLDVKATGGQCSWPGTTINPFYTVTEKCEAASQIPSFVPAMISDTVFLAPCNGTYGDPLMSDPLGKQRGVLFFQNRSRRGDVSFQGGGTILSAGVIYSHRCTTPAGVDAGGASCVAPTSLQCMGGGANNSSFCSSVTFNGSPGSATFVLGAIITDNLRLVGSSDLAMSLNPGSVYVTYKASLFR